MGRHAVVMGGGMGIGEAIARKLHADGFIVTVVDRIAALANSVANDLGENAFSDAADITKPEQLTALADVMRERVGRDGLAAVVNSVGIFDFRQPLLKTDLANFNRMLNVNVTGAFLFSQAVEPLLAANAAMVHISSVNGALAGMQLGAYKVSKAALNMLVRCLASELARDPRRIRVNAAQLNFGRPLWRFESRVKDYVSVPDRPANLALAEFEVESTIQSFPVAEWLPAGLKQFTGRIHAKGGFHNRLTPP